MDKESSRLDNEIERAENGELQSMYRVAEYIMYEDYTFRREPQMLEKAEQYFLRCAEMGNTHAMINLAALYMGEGGHKVDKDEAFKWYEKALDGGNVEAYTFLGNFCKYDHLEDGSPVLSKEPERLRKALDYFEEGASYDIPNCMYEVADFYRKGVCIEKNERKAFELYLKAYQIITRVGNEENWIKNIDYGDVCYRLAKCYHYGNGTDIDLLKAKELLQRARVAYKYWYDRGDNCASACMKYAEEEWQRIIHEIDYAAFS